MYIPALVPGLEPSMGPLSHTINPADVGRTGRHPHEYYLDSGQPLRVACATFTRLSVGLAADHPVEDAGAAPACLALVSTNL